MLRAMLSDAPIGFVLFFCFVATLVGLGFVFTIYTAVRNRNALKAAGYDPLTAQVQMADRFIRSQEHPTLESRLKELDDLHARGVISDEEHAKARADALASP
jgi:hypothetical protein